MNDCVCHAVEQIRVTDLPVHFQVFSHFTERILNLNKTKQENLHRLLVNTVVAENNVVRLMVTTGAVYVSQTQFYSRLHEAYLRKMCSVWGFEFWWGGMNGAARHWKMFCIPLFFFSFSSLSFFFIFMGSGCGCSFVLVVSTTRVLLEESYWLPTVESIHTGTSRAGGRWFADTISVTLQRFHEDWPFDWNYLQASWILSESGFVGIPAIVSCAGMVFC